MPAHLLRGDGSRKGFVNRKDPSADSTVGLVTRGYNYNGIRSLPPCPVKGSVPM